MSDEKRQALAFAIPMVALYVLGIVRSEPYLVLIGSGLGLLVARGNLKID